MTVGLDIGSKTIKIVEVEKQGNNFTLKGSGVVGYSGLSIENMKDEKEYVQLADTIKKLCKETRISKKDVVLSLPENQVFTRIVRFPLLTDQEIDSAVKWEAEQYIPIPISEAVVQHQILERKELSSPPEVVVLLIAAQQALVEKYVRLLQMAGLSISAVETELLAASRVLAPADQTVMLVDFGAVSTDIAIVKNGNLVFSRSVPSAGDSLTRAVSQSIGVDALQAEEYKKTYGMSPEQLEGKVMQSILPVYNLIVDEIRKAIQFYQTDEKDGKPTQVILIGGAAGLPGMSTKLAEDLGMEVIMGDPFQKVTVAPEVYKQIANYAPLYAIAVGLALRG